MKINIYKYIFKRENVPEALCSYIDIDEIVKMEEFLYSNHELVMIDNSMLELLRNMALSNLIKTIKGSLTSNVEDVKVMRFRVIRMVFAEIVSRSIVNKAIQKLINKLLTLICRIKYRKIYSILNDLEKEVSCELPKNGA